MKISGIVEKGKGEGRKLGFPTANLKIQKSFLLADGIYVAETRYQGKTYHSLAVKGLVDDLEVWLDDFSGDLYGQELTVAIGQKISDLISTGNQGELIAKIQSDITKARKLWTIN